MSKPIKVSVLICTYNRHELLKDALRTLIKETREKPDQVVVVNGGNEEADRVVESFRERIDIELKLVKTVNKNLAVSRNVGLPYCTGDIIAITDDDARVFPDWIAQMKHAHEEHPEAGAVGGPIFAAEDHRLINRIANYVIFPTQASKRYVRTVPGVNCSYKRKAVEETGAYDEDLFRGEDVDFNWRMKRLGYEIYHDPTIRVYHYHRTSWLGLAKQVYMYGRAYYLVRAKWPEMYSIYPHGLKNLHDFTKLGYFLFGALLEPFVWIKYQKKTTDILIGYPIGVLLSIIWRYGMLVQLALERKNKNVDAQNEK